MKARWMGHLGWAAAAAVLISTLVMGPARSEPKSAPAGSGLTMDGPLEPAGPPSSSGPSSGKPENGPESVETGKVGRTFPQKDEAPIARPLIQQAQQMEKASRDWPEAAESLRNEAETNLALALKLETSEQKEREERVETATQEKKLSDLENTFLTTRKRIDRMGLSPSSGEVLQMLRGVLSTYQADPMKGLQRRRLLLQLTREEKDFVQAQYLYKKMREELSPEKTGNFPALLPEAQILVQSRKTLLDELIRVNEQRRDELNRCMLAANRLRGTNQEFREFILEKLFWTRTSPVYNSGDEDKASDLQQGRKALAWLFSPDNWRSVARDFMDSFLQLPASWLGGLAALLLLLAARSRINNRLRLLNDRVGRPESDSVVVTLQALGLAAIRGAGFPILVVLAAKHLGEFPMASPFTRAFCSGLLFAAVLFLFLSLTRELFRAGGVGRIHFQWGESAVSAFTRGNRGLILTFLPFFFFTVMIRVGVQGEGYQGSLGRLLFCLAMVPLALLLLRLFRQGGALREEIRQRSKDTWLNKYQTAMARAVILVPPTLFLLTLLGYGYTAFVLSINLFETACMILGIAAFHATLLRWINVGRVRIAHEKRLEKRKAAAEERALAAGESAGEESLKDTIPVAPEEARLAVEDVSEQTRLLIRSITGAAFLVFVWIIWAEVLQAFRVLEGVSLYTTKVGVEADGADKLKTITLVNLILSLLIFAGTVVLARTIPAILQIVNIKRFAKDPGSRLAFGQIGRYIVLALGVGLALSQVGIGWSKFSVVAAAMTLGLSWGLQDIFSNFVSGIILLLERPVRVGDIVTVSGVSGKISRIQIRATTITNWDRQELIVPNKSFLSEKVTNWSLSDEITRVVIKVGIGYGNNPKEAQELLLKIARENALVREDPGPSVLFAEFGADSLDFALRVFVGLSDMTAVQNQLRMSIQEEFAKAGLEIPFAQRDVHLDASTPLEIRMIETS